jgi:uncharacterized protein (DUF427 family)
MLTQGPDHHASIEAAGPRFRAYFNGHVIADSAGALRVHASGREPAVFFPREDVAMEFFGRTDHVGRDPDKGEAGFYTLRMDSHILENAAMTFDAPAGSYAQIAGFVAFVDPRIEVYAVDDALVNPHHRKDASARAHRHDHAGAADVDEVVKHTDTGAGHSQGDHWDPNTTGPQGGLR